MTAISFLETDDSTVKARLIRAADAEIAEYGTEALQMEAVAKRAGVSRATAFRQLGSVSEVLVQVALLRSQRHTAELHRLMDSKAGVFAKIGGARLYRARAADRPGDRPPDIPALGLRPRSAGPRIRNGPTRRGAAGRTARRRHPR
jgi:AcrR family transcriptional regulator